MTSLPKTKLQAFRRLNRLLSKDERIELAQCSNDDLIDYHFGLGLWIRNNWIYKNDGTLFCQEPTYHTAPPHSTFGLYSMTADIESGNLIQEYRDYLKALYKL